jgi:pimeloyl-ACP methyl ester carboxylesterase
MHTVVSGDGTSIAFERAGDGPPLILVDGALCYRGSGPARPLAARLVERFTVVTYDRRGRGDSGDTPPYAVEREVEDLAALVQEAGGSAYVYGVSSGAALALEAAHHGVPITKLALYEAPFIVDDTRRPVTDGYVARVHELLAADRRGEAVTEFMKLVDVPAVGIVAMRLMPAWSRLKAVAPTLAYDTALTEPLQRGRPLPADRWNGATMPTVVISGGNSPAWMRNANRALAAVLPDASHRTLDGQTHLVKPDAIAPVLTDFFTG